MAQAGNLVVLGDAGDALGDSIYEARLFVRGKVKSLGADCIEKPMRDEHKQTLAQAARARPASTGEVDPSEFRRYGSARKLYHFPRRQCWGPIDGAPRAAGSTRRRAIRRPSTSYSIVGDPPRRGDRHLRHSRRSARSARSRISTISCSSAPRSAAIRSKAIARNAAPMSCSARASPRSRSSSRSRSPSPA